MIKLALTYLSFTTVASIIPFLMLPILSRVLTAEEYGIVAMFQLLVSFIGCFIGLSINTFNEVKFFSENEESYANLQVNSFALFFTNAFLFLFIIFVFQNVLSDVFKLDVSWVFLAYAGAFFYFPVVYTLGQLQIRKQALKYGLVQLTLAILMASLSIVLVVLLELGVQGRIFAIVFAYIAVFLLSLYVLSRSVLGKSEVIFRVDFSCWSSALRYGVPLIPHLLGGVLISSGERLVTADVLGTKAVGITVLAMQFVSIISLIGQSLNQAYIPWLYERLSRLKTEDETSVCRLIGLISVAIIVFIPLAYHISPRLFLVFMGEEFTRGAEIVFYLSLAAFLHILYFLFGNFLFYAKKTKIITFISIFSGTFYFLLLIYLVSEFDIVGVAIAVLVMRAVQLLLTVSYVNKEYPFLIRGIFDWALTASKSLAFRQR